MKHFLLATIFAMLTLASYAQNTKTLRAETPVRRSRVAADMYPKITLNENKCRFDHLTVKPIANNNYALTIVFARPCDKQNDFVLTFPDLQEAHLVKDLIMNEEDYDFFHLFNEDEKAGSFEIVYPSKGN